MSKTLEWPKHDSRARELVEVIDSSPEERKDLLWAVLAETVAVDKRRRQKDDVHLKGQALAKRAERLTDWMIFQVLITDRIVIEFNGAQKTHIFGRSASCFPTAAITWTDTANATPGRDLRSWVEKATSVLGLLAAPEVWMNSATWDVADQISSMGWLEYVTPAPELVLFDDGFRDEHSEDAIKKFIPDGIVVVVGGKHWRISKKEDWHPVMALHQSGEPTLDQHEPRHVTAIAERAVELSLPDAIVVAKVFA